MKNYELMVIIKPDLGIDAIEKRLAEVKNLIKAAKGEIFYEDIWGIKDFAYQMKKYDNGYYAILNFSLENSEGLVEMDKALRLDIEILRHIIVTLPKGYKPRSYAMEDENEDEEKEETNKPKKEVKKAKPAKKVTEEKKDNKEKTVKSIKNIDDKLKNIIDNPDLNF